MQPLTLDDIQKMDREEVIALFKDLVLEEEDHHWEDFNDGLSPRRQIRFAAVILAISAFVGNLLDEWREKGYDFAALVPIGIFSKGVKGDRGVYGPIVLIEMRSPRFNGSDAQYDVLSEISRAITSNTPATRVCLKLR